MSQIRCNAIVPALFLSVAAVAGSLPAESPPRGFEILVPADSPPLMTLAAREIQRYVYLRTGDVIPVVDDPTTRRSTINVRLNSTLSRQQYHLSCTVGDDESALVVEGGSGIATLYGAYRLAERLGVRFYLHADVIPDQKTKWKWTEWEESGTPLFEHRGIQPFHDFTEGPDWWSGDDYKACFSQLVKLRMNWFGLHCYPEGGVGPEPLVWIGLKEDVDEQGHVTFSYPSRWASTAGGAWGYAPARTSQFAAGAGQLFAADDHGSAALVGRHTLQDDVEACNDVFDRAANMLNDAFQEGRSLGISVCLGTETPLTIPKRVRQRLIDRGLNPDDSSTVAKLYEGMFTRIARALPIDYYWLWTPEGWTWQGADEKQVERTVNDIQLALEARKKVEASFGFATCGWVLGPPGNRGLFDKVLPSEVALSCINRQVGFTPVEPGFSRIHGRPQWAIPWMEDDPAMIIPQLWVGRLRRDAADAFAYGCTGLMGIHWRTRVLGPNVAALAAAGWNQAGWNVNAGKRIEFPDRPRDLPTEDFYRDWCRTEFGPSVADRLADLFVTLDGGPGDYAAQKATRLPRPATWMGGPGGIVINSKPWDSERNRYAFVAEMEAFEAQIEGAGNLARFHYWLNTFRYLRSIGQLGCVRGQLDAAVKRWSKSESATERSRLAEDLVSIRLQLARLWEQMMTAQLSVVSTPGELGTIANLEQHVRRHLHFLDHHDEVITEALGRPLPPEAEPTRNYLGGPRIIVPTVRSLVSVGEVLTIPVILLANERPKEASLHWRSIGSDGFQTVRLKHVARGVYSAQLPPADEATREYYVKVELETGQPLHWPPTAPELNATLVARP